MLSWRTVTVKLVLPSSSLFSPPFSPWLRWRTHLSPCVKRVVSSLSFHSLRMHTKGIFLPKISKERRGARNANASVRMRLCMDVRKCVCIEELYSTGSSFPSVSCFFFFLSVLFFFLFPCPVLLVCKSSLLPFFFFVEQPRASS